MGIPGFWAGIFDIYETELLRTCLSVQNQLITDRLIILDTGKTLLDSLFQDPSLIQKQIDIDLAYDKAHSMLAEYVEANKWKLIDQEKYQKRFNALENTLKQAKTDFEQAEAAVQERLARKNQIDQFISLLSEQEDLLPCFDETLWNVTVDEVLIKPSGDLVFTLKSEQQILYSHQGRKRFMRQSSIF